MGPPDASGVRSLARRDAHRDRSDARLDIAFGPVSVTDDSSPSVIVEELLVVGEMGFNLGFHSLREQALSPGSENLCERVRGPGRGLLDRDHSRL